MKRIKIFMIMPCINLHLHLHTLHSRLHQYSCCKSSTANGNFGVSQLHNPWTDRLKNWHTWLCRWHDLVCQIS